eukprot:TRINITY_DN1071_c0_g1_i2.p1 TRINITY_DN1071_c0_g1~~TRINITY_DN1071_c0_g1_i2.p1  ORF type:complete len:145 (+),score=41.18 TRINITY_DN1071_c0_g1_i2:139-573(+)
MCIRDRVSTQSTWEQKASKQKFKITSSNMVKATKKVKKVVQKKEKKPKKEKKVKDPNAPKRGLTAFLYFVQAKREVMKKEHSELAHKEIISELGKKWQSLSKKEKEPFEAKAKKDHDRYVKEKAAYIKKNPKKVVEKKSKKIKK